MTALSLQAFLLFAAPVYLGAGLLWVRDRWRDRVKPGRQPLTYLERQLES